METIARQDIQYLQQLYARATDLIGTNTGAGVERGRAIYRRIFTPDAMIRAGGSGAEQLVRQGPDSWVELVMEGLNPYSSTQHLIGTQIVEIEFMDVDSQGAVTAGKGRMESYLQGWHENRPEGNVWVYLGTYDSKVRFTPGVGWQIYDMTLSQVAGEQRALGEL